MINAELRQKCPVAWNENYGGFWFLTSYDAVTHTARDGATFAHKYEPNAADGVDYQGEMGVPRPEGQPALGIGEVDGPYHLALRHALAPFFSPGRRPENAAVHGAIGALVPRSGFGDGQMDLVLDYASPVPAILTMKLMGLPYDNWQLYANLFHSVMAVPQDSDEYASAIAEVPAMMADVIEFASTRRAEARDDLTSFLIRFEFDGKRLDDDTAAQHPLESHCRRRGHHYVADRVDPAASGHPPGAAATAHRPPGALPHRHRRIPALLLGQQITEPHGDSRRRRSAASI